MCPCVNVTIVTRQTRQPVRRHCYCPLRIHTPYMTPFETRSMRAARARPPRARARSRRADGLGDGSLCECEHVYFLTNHVHVHSPSRQDASCLPCSICCMPHLPTLKGGPSERPPVLTPRHPSSKYREEDQDPDGGEFSRSRFRRTAGAVKV